MRDLHRAVHAFVAIGVMLFVYAARGEVAALPQEIRPDNPGIRYIGRFDTRDAAGPRAAWSNSAVEVHFRGAAANIKLKSGGRDQYQVIVNGKPTTVLKPTSGTALYCLAANLPAGEHAVQLVKRTEAHTGVFQVLGVQLEQAAELLPPNKVDRRVEVIGDSISCGYGNEAANQNQHYTPDTQNGYLTYGALAARCFGADFHCIAWSGRKLWPDYTLPSIYDRILPDDEASHWDAAGKAPQVVLINLATNDFGKGVPDEKGWTGAYVAFIATIRKACPEAHIFLASGSMMSDSWPPNIKALSTLKGYLDKVAGELTQGGDKRIHRVDFDPQDGNRDGLGGDWHPNLKTHNLMAGKLVEAIAKELGWKPLVAVEPVAVPQPAAAAAPAASEKPAAAEKMIVWDGEAKKGGSGWTAPEKSGTIAPQERDAHSATAALEWHGTAAAETYAGCGWNWFGWWPADSGTDISAYGQLSFWVKVTGSPANPAIQVSLNCSSTKKPTAAVPLADYAKDFADGQWHQVTIPLQDIYKKEKTDFDPKTAWELDLGTWNMDAADLHVFIDDIGFARQK